MRECPGESCPGGLFGGNCLGCKSPGDNCPGRIPWGNCLGAVTQGDCHSTFTLVKNNFTISFSK